MICYPETVSVEDVSLLNDYWFLSKEHHFEFHHLIKDVKAKHSETKQHKYGKLVNNSSFCLTHAFFACQECSCKIPARNRKGFMLRIKRNVAITCEECLDAAQQIELETAHQAIAKFRAEKFQPTHYLKTLSTTEILFLLSIWAEQSNEKNLLGKSLCEVSITGVESIDHSILYSLIEKNALIFIPILPTAIVRANKVVNRGADHIKHLGRYRQPTAYRSPDSIEKGVYLNPPAMSERSKPMGIVTTLYQQLTIGTHTISDVKKIHETIMGVQLDKLFKLVAIIGKKRRLIIDDSNEQRSLLFPLANNYPPINLFYTFDFYGRETAACLYTEEIPHYRGKHYFTSILSSYIQLVESRNYSLYKTLPLPPEIHTSPFEALFSELYLTDHSNWNMLSAKEIVALWLQKIHLTDGVKELLSEGEIENSNQ